MGKDFNGHYKEQQTKLTDTPKRRSISLVIKEV